MERSRWILEGFRIYKCTGCGRVRRGGVKWCQVLRFLVLQSCRNDAASVLNERVGWKRNEDMQKDYDLVLNV